MPLYVLLKIKEKSQEKTTKNITDVIKDGTIFYSVIVENEMKFSIIRKLLEFKCPTSIKIQEAIGMKDEVFKLCKFLMYNIIFTVRVKNKA